MRLPLTINCFLLNITEVTNDCCLCCTTDCYVLQLSASFCCSSVQYSKLNLMFLISVFAAQSGRTFRRHLSYEEFEEQYTEYKPPKRYEKKQTDKAADKAAPRISIMVSLM